METLRELLLRAWTVSDSHFKHAGKWSLWNQIGHVHSEVTEIYNALRDMGYKDAEGSVLLGRTDLIEEIWDVIYSCLTIAHLLEIDMQELLIGCEKTMRKIERRVGIEAD